jgi:hypothetical protein
MNFRGEIMDADNRIIPVVEGDQGEGWKEPLSEQDLKDIMAERERMHKQWQKKEERSSQKKTGIT